MTSKPRSRTTDEAADAAETTPDADADEAATTNQLLHRLAVGLTRVQISVEKAAAELESAAKATAERAEPVIEKGRAKVKEGADRARPVVERGVERSRDLAERAREAARTSAEHVGPALDKAGAMATETGKRARAAGQTVARGAGEVAHSTADVLERARSRSVGFALTAEERAEHAAENLREMSSDLANRARAARAAGVDFFDRHREEIIALVITAAKVAAVIGIRRLARPKEEDSDGRAQKGNRLVDTMSVLSAVLTHVGELLARNPSALPLLREMYAKGNPSEQAVVGMLVGPALGSNPNHAADVVREFLEDATSEAAADTIARRTLTPLLRENPELLEKVLPWVDAASGYVKRAALIALARQVGDRHSRLGDIVAASVVVLEDHDEEVREALGWLLQAASEIDMDEVARAVRDRLAGLGPDNAGRAREVVAGMPKDLQARIEALEEEDA